MSFTGGCALGTYSQEKPVRELRVSCKDGKNQAKVQLQVKSQIQPDPHSHEELWGTNYSQSLSF